jgi:hypothetical protein
VSSTKTTAADRLNLYTWFPFESGRCGDTQDVVLLDEWLFEHNGKFSGHKNLYPKKVPNNFMGCPIKVGSVGIKPLVIMAENNTHNNGSSVYRMTGF